MIVSIYALCVLPFSILGNEVLFSLETASDYVKDEKACFYGFKCVAVGFEFNPGLDEVKKKNDLHISLWMASSVMHLMTASPFTDSRHLTCFQGLIMLEKELAYLGSVCAAALMKKDLALPIGT